MCFLNGVKKIWTKINMSISKAVRNSDLSKKGQEVSENCAHLMRLVTEEWAYGTS